MLKKKILQRGFYTILFLCITPLQGLPQENLPLLTLTPIISGLESPVEIVNSEDSSGRLFIILQSGQVVILDNNNLLEIPFLDIRERVQNSGRQGDERGLLGFAFHPQYASNRFFYVNYTNSQGNTVISRFTANESFKTAKENSEHKLLTIEQPFSNHNGGQIKFGPDNFLYIATGDGGAAGDPQNHAQNLQSLLGKILRIDVNGDDFPANQERNYSIPKTNPFIQISTAMNEIWAYGLRNPWKFSFDQLTGALFIGDVGQRQWEEVSWQSPNSSGGENYGWRLMEGNHCFIPENNCPKNDKILPIIEYPHKRGEEFIGCSIIGGYQYRGASIPQLFGTYLYGDFCSGKIWGAHKLNGKWETNLLFDTDLSITSFGEDEDGTIYISDLATGSILQLVGPSVGGCVTFDGGPLANRKVNLKQEQENKQKTQTDAEGCFSFDHLAHGKKFEITIKGPRAP